MVCEMARAVAFRIFELHPTQGPKTCMYFLRKVFIVRSICSSVSLLLHRNHKTRKGKGKDHPVTQ